MKGKVFLVGAGPGARDLITVRGLSCLRRAEVVLYDKLASDRLLEDVPADAERIYVGKQGGHKTYQQDEICALLVRYAGEAKRVVRLKGGDPFLFGRGGEEAAALAAADIPFEVVPGVTSAVAVPAFAGIPVTFRGKAEGFEVITGHQATDRPSAERGDLTTVVLMGRRRLAENVALLRRRYPKQTPAALIQHGTLAQQRCVIGTLETIEDRAAALGAPAVLVVGSTVDLARQLAWLEQRPLFGRRVLVTRARDQAGETCRILEELGAETIAMPTIAIYPPRDPLPLARAVGDLGSYDYLIVTSANTVARLWGEVERQRLDGRAFAGLTICAVGPGTAAALGELGLRADLIPEKHQAEGLLALLDAERVAGRRILLPRAEVAREILPRMLESRGAEVDLVCAYRTGLPDRELTRSGRSALERDEVDVLFFTSASTVENLGAILGDQLGPLTRGKLVAAIGPITAEACRRMGLPVDVEPDESTLKALAQALVSHLKRQQTHRKR